MTQLPRTASEEIVKEGGWSTPSRLRNYIGWLFRDIDFHGKHTLDVGGGTGVFTFSTAALGAARAVCLEPELEGSTSGVQEVFARIQGKTGASNAKLVRETLQAYDGADGPFDLVLLHNSINHVDEPACEHLLEGGVYRERFLAIGEKLAGLTKPGGTLIICDCTRRNFFNDIGLRSPVAPTIEWQKHQSPETWAELFSHTKFGDPKIQWTAFNFMGPFGFLLRNRPAQYFLQSHFKLTLTRRP